MTGATRHPLRSSRDFDLHGLRVAVIEVAGTVQLLYLSEGWEGGPRKVFTNQFADTGTPAQLRQLADYLEALALPEPMEPR